MDMMENSCTARSGVCLPIFRAAEPYECQQANARFYDRPMLDECIGDEALMREAARTNELRMTKGGTWIAGLNCDVLST
jgi:hypothetical protein